MAKMIELHSAKYMRRLVREVRAAFPRGAYYGMGTHCPRVKGIGYSKGSSCVPAYVWVSLEGDDRASRVVSDLTAFKDGGGKEIVASREA